MSITRSLSLAAGTAALAALTATTVAAVPATAATGADAGLGAPSVVADGLNNPYSLAWGAHGKLWLTEKSGRSVLSVDPATGAKSTLLDLSTQAVSSGQDGVLGLAVEPSVTSNSRGYAYVSYTYDSGQAEESTGETRRTKIVRYSYDDATKKLVRPTTIISGLPGSIDHQAGRLLIGPDGKLYYSIGDQGTNQYSLACRQNQAQTLPTAAEVAAKDWFAYQGKTLRLNRDGSIPVDNPTIDGVRSHIWTYGHRNPQGFAFTASGKLLEAEHGPKTDDELNVLRPGGNYGWPNVAGYQDDQSAYVYGDWSASSPTPCAELTHSDFEIHEDVPTWKESEFTERFHEPLDTFGTSVTWDHDFTGAPCDASGLYYICYPTIAPSSLTYYKPAVGRAMPGWENSVIMTSLKDGTIYRLALNTIETDVVAVEPLYTDQDRFRATIVSPDGKTVYAITDTAGLVRGEGDAPTTDLTHPGSLLAFPVTN
ncbi:glucose/sorbosone family PQQ-dependent dehydrogenase [Nocardioides turkmenicus]|uniref:glucose/sorbosone family PQQ-dependent dehydrogenase n=1 Tax=Nocardioides turkmenicus TaxID=2711220 RepID=UPI0019CF4FC6|nr:glucose/sorbosone family PQQ-dependent dehydrogenase [Nocardioides sp. KC13]